MFIIAVPSPDFVMIHEILKISMETSAVVAVSKMLTDESQHYISQWVESYTQSKNYDLAHRIAKLAGLPVNDVLIAEWSHKHELLLMKEDVILDDKGLTLFIAQCSEAFKKTLVTFDAAVKFLTRFVQTMTDMKQRFYSYRVILSWFVDNLQYGKAREEIEHLMWDAYFQCESQSELFLNNYHSTLHFILGGQRDQNLAKKIGQLNSEKPFSLLLSEIETESDVANIDNVVLLKDTKLIDAWRKAMNHLLELKLMVDAFRLSALFRYVYGAFGTTFICHGVVRFDLKVPRH